MKKIILALLALSAIIVLAACGDSESGGNSSEEEMVYLSVGAPPSTSDQYGYWAAVTEAIEGVYPELQFTLSESQGAVDISEKVRSEQVDLGNSVSNTDFDSHNGVGSFENEEEYKDLRMLWYYDQNSMQWIVSTDSGVDSLKDLDGEKFNPGATNTSAEAITLDIMEELGVEPNYFEAAQDDALDAVENRQIIGTTKSDPVPSSYLQQVQGTIDSKIIGLSDEELEQIIDTYDYLIPGVIEDGSYEGMDGDVNTVDIMMGAQTNKDLPQEVGYKMVKAAWDVARDDWVDGYTSGKDSDFEELVLESKIPLHAGTVQYLKEINVDVPDELIPEEYEENE